MYNTYMYYNNKFQNTNSLGIDMVNRSKKKRLFLILTGNLIKQKLKIELKFCSSSISSIFSNLPRLSIANKYTKHEQSGYIKHY